MRPIVAETALSAAKGVENESSRAEGRGPMETRGWSGRHRASSRGEREKKKGGRII